MKVGFSGTAEVVLSFEAEDAAVTPGYPVSLCGNDQVADAPAGAIPIGIGLQERCGIAAVQMKGFAEVPYSGAAPQLGWNSLLADGAGGLKAGSDGLPCLVVHVDTEANTLGLYL